MQPSKLVEFEVGYQCRPQPHLEATPGVLIQVLEVMFNGAIIDCDKANKSCVVTGSVWVCHVDVIIQFRFLSCQKCSFGILKSVSIRYSFG